MNEDELKKIAKDCFKATTDALIDTLDSSPCDDKHKVAVTHHTLKLLTKGVLSVAPSVLTAVGASHLRRELIEIIDEHLKEEK